MNYSNVSKLSIECKDSSLLSKIEWDSEGKKYNLKLYFKPTDVCYTYKIPLSVFSKFLSAESLGKFFSQYIKNEYEVGKE